MSKTIVAQSGHTLFVEPIEFDALPEDVKNFKFINDYSKHYVVKNWDADGVVFMYLGTAWLNAENAKQKREVVVWYRNGGFWSGFGTTFEEAINGAQKDGWMYA